MGRTAYLCSRPGRAAAASCTCWGVRVLVIDDEAPIRLLCRINLEAEGMEVLEAATGPAGLALARAELPDVVLLDVMMPGLDGWQVAGALFDEPATSALPIVFLTARAELRDRAQGIGIGGVEYVTKPFDPVELATVVRELVGRQGPGGEGEGGGGGRPDGGEGGRRRARLAELRALVDGP